MHHKTVPRDNIIKKDAMRLNWNAHEGADNLVNDKPISHIQRIFYGNGK